MSRTPILEAAFQSIGSASKLAAAIGVSPQAVAQWKSVPIRRVLDIEEVTGIPRHVLRPDIYPAPSRERIARGTSE